MVSYAERRLLVEEARRIGHYIVTAYPESAQYISNISVDSSGWPVLYIAFKKLEAKIGVWPTTEDVPIPEGWYKFSLYSWWEYQGPDDIDEIMKAILRVRPVWR